MQMHPKEVPRDGAAFPVLVRRVDKQDSESLEKSDRTNPSLSPGLSWQKI